MSRELPGLHHYHGDEKDDLLVPDFNSPSRRSHEIVAVFNLIATIVGGGVLSLPLAFCKLGIGLATILMIGAAIITDQTLYLLCLSARLTGASSYGEIGRMAYGPAMETFIAILLFVFLMFVIVAYMVLLRDIWTPLVGLLPGLHDPNGNVVMVILLLLLIPFLVQHSLHSLRYNCYIGFASVSILCVALCHHGIFRPSTSDLTNEEPLSSHLLIATKSWSDILFSFPIIMLSFLSHFNVLPIQAALVCPTRSRMSRVIHWSVSGCFVLMYLFGLGGYVFAGSGTQGNILLNVTLQDDWMFVLGRIGCGLTILFATPMMALPCRENALEILDILTGNEQQVDVTVIGEQTALVREEPIQADPVFRNHWIHYGSTLVIIATCYLGAALVPSVAIVWSLCGSCMAFLIAFILPTLYYLVIRKKEHLSLDTTWGRVAFSWIVLVTSIVSAALCTINTIARMLQGS